MAVTEIVQFNTEGPVSHDTIDNAVNALQRVKTPKQFVIGTHVQDNSAVQITAEWADEEASKGISDRASFTNSLRSSLGAPTNIFHVPFNTGSTFANAGPATSNTVEYVQIWFPVSRTTPAFQQQIERDFIQFDETFNKAGQHPGQGRLAYGWVQEEQSHPDIPGEAAKSFLVTRGWEAMSGFEQSTQTEAYKEAIPILLAWEAPFKMVSPPCRYDTLG